MYTITYFWNAEAEVADDRFGYAVIPARQDGKWVFVRQKTKATFELPGGRREAGETILETARRELHEETGATQFTLEPIAAFAVTLPDKPVAPDVPCGMLYLADIQVSGPVPPDSEIGENQPGRWPAGISELSGRAAPPLQAGLFMPRLPDPPGSYK